MVKAQKSNCSSREAVATPSLDAMCCVGLLLSSTRVAGLRRRGEEVQLRMDRAAEERDGTEDGSGTDLEEDLLGPPSSIQA